MKINSSLVKNLRTTKNWSQDQLANACGLTLRTIQRLENTGNSSLESVRALAAVFEIDANQLILNIEKNPLKPFDAVKTGFIEYANFTGTASRCEYWWFFLALVLILAIAQLINDSAYKIVSVIILVPLLAAGTRRLRETGKSGWWQLLFIVPFGFVVVLWLLSIKGQAEIGALDAQSSGPSK